MTTREAADSKEDEDFIEHLFTASTHDYILFFTMSGRAYVERVHEIPDMGRTAKGRSIANVLELKPDEKIAALLCIKSKKGANDQDLTWTDKEFLLMATRNGVIKKTPLSEFSNIRKGGIIAINIEEKDVLIDVKLTHGNDEVVLITRDGMSIRFHEEEARPMGRATYGVRGINLDKSDAVVALAVVDPKATLLVAGGNAIGKRTPFDEYRKQSRGGKGIITMKTNDRTGGVVGALTVVDPDEIMLITVKGQMVRTSVKNIREAGRNTQGVKLVNLDSNDHLQALACVISEQVDAPNEGVPA
jgi:DNA gyrase subunit A